MFGKATTLHAFDGIDDDCYYTFNGLVCVSKTAKPPIEGPPPIEDWLLYRYDSLLKLKSPGIYSPYCAKELLECFSAMPPEWREQPESKQVGDILLKRASSRSSRALKTAYNHEHMDMFAQLLDNGAMFDSYWRPDLNLANSKRNNKVAMRKLYKQVWKPRNLFLESIGVPPYKDPHEYRPKFQTYNTYKTTSLFL